MTFKAWFRMTADPYAQLVLLTEIEDSVKISQVSATQFAFSGMLRLSLATYVYKKLVFSSLLAGVPLKRVRIFSNQKSAF